MKYVREIKLSKEKSAFYREAMKKNSKNWPSETLSETAVFDNGYEIDIKLCSADDGGYWTEAVLFWNGSEVCCTEPCDDFFGEWELECDGTIYSVIMEESV
jgi:hypothetical protein